jgi:dienelactone hydrolase
MTRLGVLWVSATLWLASASPAADPLPGTKPLDEKGDLARVLVDGLHKYLDRELAEAPEKRDAGKPDRARLRKVLGVVDERLPPRLSADLPPGTLTVFDGSSPPDLEGVAIHRVRWDVLPGVKAEGLFLRGKSEVGKVVARVVAIPRAGQSPEELAGLEGGGGFALRLARNGCDVLIPTLIDRADTFSANPKLGRQTNIPHREFVHRMAYEMGRTLLGYEVQKVLAAADLLAKRVPDAPLGVIGVGDGGRVALYAAAVDERFTVCQVAGAFGPQEALWSQPLDRNLWGLLREFGDAEVGSLIAPRKLIVDTTPGPKWSGPAAPKAGRGGAAPGSLAPIPDAEVTREFERLRRRAGDAATMAAGAEDSANPNAFLAAFGVTKPVESPFDRARRGSAVKHPDPHTAARQKRQFDQLVAYTQKLWRDSEAVRKEFWTKADASSPEAWEKSCDWYREYFHREVIGKLPDPTMPMNPRTRLIYDEPTWTGYEVVLDVYPDVIASGILCLPKGMKPDERRPVVVCQHGLEGRPQDVVNPKEKTRAYNSFGARLADRGYIVYAPQNPYIFENHFRQVQRKANPLKLSLFSFIIAQHKRTLDWLETLPNVDPERIGFYGLSYGGKTAMRVPAVEKRYCLSICSGDFNEWIGKNVSVDLDRSYMWTREYEMYEFDLGHTFNYAEMAYLIAPRPFMVERGHDDGVGTDEMVAYEYAKVRYLYANRLKIPGRTTIEFSPGGHEVFLKGTLSFLEEHLGDPGKAQRPRSAR